MPREVVVIPASGPGRELAPAMFLATLAYPDEEQRRNGFLQAVQSADRYYQLRRRSGPLAEDQRADLEQPPCPHRPAQGVIKAGFRRIFAHRQLAGAVAHALLVRTMQYGNLTLKLKLIDHIHHDGVAINYKRDAIKAYLDKHNSLFNTNHNQDYFDREIWAKSKPVLHLAISWQLARERRGSARRADLMLWNPAWVDAAIAQAELLGQWIVSARIRVAEDQTIQLLQTDKPEIVRYAHPLLRPLA